MATPTTAPVLVPVEQMEYEDFVWCVENGIDPFKTPEEREAEALARFAEASRRVQEEAIAARGEDLLDNHWLEAAISDAS